VKKSRKLFTALTALVLAVVGAIAAVTSVLAAQSQSVTSTLQVTYEATNVYATVGVTSKTQNGNYGNADSHTFNPADGNASAHALTAHAESLGFENASDSTFERYAIYKFSFQNKYASGGRKLTVSMAVSGVNENAVVAYASNATTDTTPSLAPTTTDTTWALSSADTTAGWSTTIPSLTVTATNTGYIYMVVAVKNTTLPIASQNISVSFTLGTANP